jgi:hypothetical protein
MVTAWELPAFRAFPGDTVVCADAFVAASKSAAVVINFTNIPL